MQRARFTRRILWVLLAGWVGSAGCTHNYYYGSVPVACAPGTAVVPGTVVSSVCDPPAQVVSGGNIVASSPGIRSSVTTTAPPSSSQVVVSEPVNRPRLSWRRSDPEGIPITRHEGDLGDDATVK